MRRILYIIWLIPFLWIIGGERLLLPVVVVAVFGLSIFNIGSLPRPVFWLLLFLAAYLVSALQVESTVRYITFFWDFLIYLCLFLVAFHFYRASESFHDVELVVRHLVMLMFLFHLLALTYFIIGDWRFETLIGKLIPASIKATQVGSKVAVHGVGRELYFLGIGTRLASVFVSSMQYAAASLLTIPSAFYFMFRGSRSSRMFFALVFVVSCVGMFFSQGRTAIVLSALAVISMIVAHPLARSRYFSRSGSVLMVAVIAAFGGIVYLISHSVLFEYFDYYFVQQRASSYEERFEIYSLSMQEIIKSPVLGHGTQTTVEDIGIPLGSHNWYMSVLYKQGLLGFIPFIVFLTITYAKSINNIFAFGRLDGRRNFSLMLAVTVCAHAALCLTAEPVVDAIHVFFISIYFGAIYSIDKLWRVSANASNADGALMAPTEGSAGTFGDALPGRGPLP
ncbi:O-antigen ligase family protein [Luteimonas salinilitoris]|uniref:O-antigen ligase family protein n=1 Tax=Luteimonas salinilitoris TaxID=3237697 RepID=A0ABV4HQA9_9GAMM